MNYAIIDNDIITSHGSASELWPDTSFSDRGPDAIFLAAAGAVVVRSDPPRTHYMGEVVVRSDETVTYYSGTDFLKDTEPYILNGTVYDKIIAPIEPE